MFMKSKVNKEEDSEREREGGREMVGELKRGLGY